MFGRRAHAPRGKTLRFNAALTRFEPPSDNYGMSVLFNNITHGLIKNDDGNMYPSRLYCHRGPSSTFSEEYSHVFGIVVSGTITLFKAGVGEFVLRAGMYFSSPGTTVLTGEGEAVIFERKGFRGLFQIGGPIERQGRLCYMDNCRATVLVSPPRLGDPVLNLLTFPPHVEQTRHIHPTLRMGAVLSGAGTCQYGADQQKALVRGSVFYLPEATPHCFNSGHEPLVVIAYHPDSDVGPTDSQHPMLSRTYTKF